MTAALAVICKEPRPGLAKTRLTPPCSAEQAASLAAALLEDTWTAARSAGGELVAVAHGDVRPWSGEVRRIEQCAGELGARLAHAFDALGGPAFLIGMDTPQVTRELLAAGRDALLDHDAVLGLAADGGYWGIGLRRADPGLFAAVPMSTPDAGRVQLERLHAAGLSVAMLPELEDVDDMPSARRVAAAAPESVFARRLAALDLAA